MNGGKQFRAVLFAMFVGAGLCSVLLSGCVSRTQARTPATKEGDELAANAQTDKGGARLWGERCTQCHYARDPGTFSQEQWEIIMLHMRVRANLTAAERRAIMEFFRSAN
jgi:hypothetical protein